MRWWAGKVFLMRLCAAFPRPQSGLLYFEASVGVCQDRLDFVSGTITLVPRQLYWLFALLATWTHLVVWEADKRAMTTWMSDPRRDVQL